jgi:hypothetical protein
VLLYDPKLIASAKKEHEARACRPFGL